MAFKVIRVRTSPNPGVWPIEARIWAGCGGGGESHWLSPGLQAWQLAGGGDNSRGWRVGALGTLRPTLCGLTKNPVAHTES